jgi:hypothetical protein
MAAMGSDALAAGGHFGLEISTHATRNVTFSQGIFKATADDAVLNVGDLENALTSGNVEVTNGSGAGGDEMGDMHIDTAITWSSAFALKLISYHSLFIEQPVADAGAGALWLTTDHGGKKGIITYGPSGSVTLWDLANTLMINGAQYTLVADIDTLAGDIAANPAGLYALAGPYNAKKHGAWKSSPIPTAFTGTFDGLGNAISGLSIYARYPATDVALFSTLSGGALNHVRLTSASVHARGLPNGAGVNVATLVGTADSGALFEDSVSGVISVSNNGAAGLVGSNYANIVSANADVAITSNAGVGGLVLENGGTITQSHAQGAISGGGRGLLGGLAGYNDRSGIITVSNASTRIGLADADDYGQNGGLVGENQGIIDQCFATGSVSGAYAGGLVGAYDGSMIKDSYATGAATGAAGARAVGGLIGAAQSGGEIENVYSTGAVSAKKQGAYQGGLLGDDFDEQQVFTDSYWDTDTSGITNLSQGAGTPANDPGITGLTSAQLQSGLPAGFSPKIWAENPSINNGFPYLIANPPQ